PRTRQKITSFVDSTTAKGMMTTRLRSERSKRNSIARAAASFLKFARIPVAGNVDDWEWRFAHLVILLGPVNFGFKRNPFARSRQVEKRDVNLLRRLGDDETTVNQHQYSRGDQ